MLFHKSPNDPTGAVDLYPHADNEQDAVMQSRLTIIYGKVYYNGNEWTAKYIQREKKRILELEAAFLVAQKIIECERQPRLI